MKNRKKLMDKHFKKNTGKPDDKVTEIINEDIDQALIRANMLIGDKTISEPIIIKTADTEFENVRFKLSKEDDDFNVEYDKSLVTALYLGAHDLTFFQTKIDHTTGHVGQDALAVVKYRDIVNNELFITNDYNEKLDTVVSKVIIELSLKDGDMLVISLRNHHEFTNDKYPNILTDDERYVVDTLKKAIN